MTALAEAFVDIRADTSHMPDDLRKGTDAAVNKSEPALRESGKKLGGHLGSGVIGGMGGIAGSLKNMIGPAIAAVGIGVVTAKLVDFTKQARDSAAMSRITEQVIKSTGGAAHISAAGVSDLATAISNKTGVDDDAIKSSENLLLTFTNVQNQVGKGNDIFNQATAAVTDMSVALGQDAKSSSIQLGKALNDPVKGITALSRVGVSFTDQQQKQIQTLVKHNDTLGAQKIILKELGREFGGAAAAASDPMAKLGVTLGNLGKDLAGKLLPFLDKAATFIMASVIPAVQQMASWMGTNLLPVLKTVGSWIGANLLPVLAQVGSFLMGTVVPAVKAGAAVFQANILPALKQVWSMVAANLKPALVELGTFWKGTLQPLFERAWPIIQKVAIVLGYVAAAVAVAVSWLLGKLVPVLTTVIGWTENWMLTIIDVAATILLKFGTVIDFFKKIPGWIGDGMSTVANIIMAPFKVAFNGIAALWNGTVGSLSFSIPSWVPVMGGDSFSVPKIPTLAAGGVVPATAGGRLIIAGEGGQDEIVAPESKLRQIVADALAGTGTRGGMVIEQLNVAAAPGEAAAESIPRALRREAFLLGIGG